MQPLTLSAMVQRAWLESESTASPCLHASSALGWSLLFSLDFSHQRLQLNTVLFSWVFSDFYNPWEQRPGRALFCTVRGLHFPFPVARKEMSGVTWNMRRGAFSPSLLIPAHAEDPLPVCFMQSCLVRSCWSARAVQRRSDASCPHNCLQTLAFQPVLAHWMLLSELTHFEELKILH